LLKYMTTPCDESWKVLLGLFPKNWEQQARATKSIERLRGFDTAEQLLRVLLLHVGQGYSLRETVVRAKASALAEISDVALLKRLRNADEWFRSLCLLLLAENGIVVPAASQRWRIRVLDGSIVKEPGRTGSQWRLHYSLQLPSMICDHLAITAVRGAGVGEKLNRFPAQPGDLILADRGLCTPTGIADLVQQGAHLIVRVNTGSLPLQTSKGRRFPLQRELQKLPQAGDIREWDVETVSEGKRISGRLCVLRKSETQARRAVRKIHRRSQQGGPDPKTETLTYAHYVIVFTTLQAQDLSAAQVLEWYRLRWQIELVFKRLKTLLRVGHVPKHDDRSSHAWLYGKLLVALLAEKLIRVGREISPWGYSLSHQTTT
jgi:hypothetical protein